MQDFLALKQFCLWAHFLCMPFSTLRLLVGMIWSNKQRSRLVSFYKV